MSFMRLLPAALCAALLLSACDSQKPRDQARGGSGAPLERVEVLPAAAGVPAGRTQQFMAFAVFADGTRSEVTGEARWTSSSEAIATVDDAGLATGVAPGTAAIHAAFRNQDGSAQLTVGPAVLTDLVVAPSPVSIPAGATQQFTATAVFSDGRREAASGLSWSSSAPGIASVDGNGLATALSVGSTQIVAQSGTVTGHAQLEVTAGPELPLPFTAGAADASASFLPLPGAVCLGGYDLFCERKATTERDPLRAEGFAVTGKDQAGFLLVKTTNVGYFAAYKAGNGPNGLYDIRQRIARRLEQLHGSAVLPADRIIVTADHSHQAPDTIGIWGGVSPAYMALLAQAAVDAGVQAWQNRAPARLFAASVQGPPTEGSYDAPPTDDPDREFRVLYAETRGGARIATLVNYAPHATVLSSDNVSATGDWTAWAAQIANETAGGVGIGLVGALGAMDWNKSGDDAARETEARARLRSLLDAAFLARSEVAGDTVAVKTVFIREPLTQPILLSNLAPGATLPMADGRLSIERAETAPWNTGAVIGTYAAAARLGDVFISAFPGEPFPQLHYALRDCSTLPEGIEADTDCGSIQGARVNFLLGGANDFLGYMVYTPEQYQQTLQEGALYLSPEGCDEVDLSDDGACPDHWTLMVSPTIGRHIVCTVQDAAAGFGFTVSGQNEECPLLTAFDGLAAPAEYPAVGLVPVSPAELINNPGAGVAANCRAQGGPEALCAGLDQVGAAVGAALSGAAHSNPLPPVPSQPSRAGVAVRDASWHLGASAGQFSASGAGIARDAGFDPYGHSTRKVGSDILGTRISVRALVVEDGDGNRVAIAANDLYLPNDLLHRRVAQRLREHDALARLTGGTVTGITDANLATTSSHSHTSPFYSTPGWGTWIFQDVFDLRFYEYMAAQMAEAVIAAAADLRPVRMGGATAHFNGVQAHTYGPKVDAENGTPAGQPYDYTTQQVTVVRFDDMTDPGAPKPYANWVIFGVHPEWVWGEEIVNGDITHATMRMLDRETGAITVMSQRETGASGPHKDTRVHPPEARREFQEAALAGADRGARLLADTIKEALADIAAGTPEFPSQFAPFATHFRVAHASQRFAPPATRPYPGISNCNTDPFFEGSVGLPILGFPDCFYDHTEFTDLIVEPFLMASPVKPEQLRDQLVAAGVPVPTSYSATSFTAVEETAAVHLQVFKLGGIVATMCPCEQFTSTAHNIVSRLDKVADNVWTGFDWVCLLPREHALRANESPKVTAHCERQNRAYPENGVAIPGSLADAAAITRIRAQIHNDAAGWELDPATLNGEAEAADPAEIKGNFSHDEYPAHGYDLVISVGMVNDYWGYVPEYREYRSHDHYRKALNGLGPHGSDFLATRLTRMAANLNYVAATLPFNPLDQAYQAESARADALAQTLGEMARAYTAVYDQQIPADGGAARITQEPAGIVPRFSAAVLKFVGGSNYAGMPEVRVERKVGDQWQTYGTQEGEVQLQLKFLPSLLSESGELPVAGEGVGLVVPHPAALATWRAGMFEWEWTATFEAFISELPNLGARPAVTPEGVYRFVVTGQKRGAADMENYELTSGEFTVVPWNGITVGDMRVESDGRVSFAIGPVNEFRRFKHNVGNSDIVVPDGEPGYVVGPVDYPDSYAGGLSWIRNDRQLFTYGARERADDPASNDQQYCNRCTFRPWADAAQVATATVTVTPPGGDAYTLAAQASGGRWITSEPIPRNASAQVASGGIIDQYGERNGQPSAAVTRAPTPP